MTIRTEHFSVAHLDDAARLLAQRHTRDREHVPSLPARFEQSVATLEQLESALSSEAVGGFAAIENGVLLGFALGESLGFDPDAPFSVFIRDRAVSVAYERHAAEPGREYDVYRRLYAELSRAWIEAGRDVHYINVPAHDRAVQSAWFSLGFGHEDTRAARPTLSPIEADPNLAIRPATIEDVPLLARQAAGILADLAKPPALLSPPPEGSHQKFIPLIEDLLNQPNLVHWVAEIDGQPAGMVLVDTVANAGEPLTVPERAFYVLGAYTEPEVRGTGVATALLARTLTWGADYGHDWCLLEYLPGNIPAAAFWQRHSFKPVSYRLCRQLDERVVRGRPHS